MNIIITGATGNLGRALLKELSGDGNNILCIGHNSKIAEDINVCAISSNAENLLQALKDFHPDVVIHAAGIYGRSGESAAALIETNVVFGVKLLEMLTNTGLKKFFYIGTGLPAEVSLYALSKRHMAAWGHVMLGTGFIDVELQQFYGESCNADNLITKFIIDCFNNKDIELTEGRQKRDIIHLHDVCSALTMLIHSNRPLPPAIEIGTGEAEAMHTIFSYIHNKTNSKGVLKFGAIPPRINEPEECKANNAFMRSMGWNYVYNYREGLDRTIESIRKKL
jgi:nucleoside-diphosphate-sugar epimerase